MSETRMTAAPVGPKSALIGAVLGNYRITGELSRGGMGAVFNEKHELLGRPAAVKLLRPELSENAELVQRFFNEAKAATAIRHPGIVEVYDFGYTDTGHAFLVMELLDGKPLGTALRHVGRYSELEAANIARGIASALKAAHAQGIVHRDLKPDNVFLVPDLEGPTGGVRTKVLDFGVAKLNDLASAHHTQTGVMLGTPLYMPPEQARAAGAIDHRADLYSLGCILYEMLVGTPPFLAEGAGEVIALHMFADPEPVRAKVPDISPEMECIVMRLLHKEPADRFQSAAEVMQALGARLSAELIAPASGAYRAPQRAAESVRLPLADEVPPRARRSALPLVAGAITLAVAAIVVAVVATRGEDRAPAAQPPPEPTVVEHAPPPPVTPPPVQADHRDLRVVETPKPPAHETVIDAPKKPPAKKQPAGKGPTTDNGSPIELDLDDKRAPR